MASRRKRTKTPAKRRAKPSSTRARATAALATETRLRFLLDAGRDLASSLDYRETLTTLTARAVPAIADWCAVDLLDDGGNLERLAVAHRDPGKIQLVRELEAKYPEARDSATGSYARIAAKRTDWLAEIPDALLAGAAQNAEHLGMIRALGLRSYISVPMVAEGRALGLLTVVMAESGRRYEAEDVPMVEGLARRAAVAIEHARAHATAKEVASRLEMQALMLARQTAQLRESEQFVRDIVESIADPMVVYDDEWNVRYENGAARQIFLTNERGRSMVGRNLWREYPDLAGTAYDREMRRAMDARLPTVFSERRNGTWTEVHCYPLPQGGLAVVWRNVTEQKRAQLTLEYLAKASDVLSASLDPEEALGSLARLVVPQLADWCSISLIDGARIRLVAAAHVDPSKVALVRSMEDSYPSDPRGNTRTAHVIRTGQPDLIPEISDAMLDDAIENPAYRAMLRQVGFSGVLTVPLAVGGRVLGAMSFASLSTDVNSRFDEADLALASELGRRAAIAVEHAASYKDAVAARAAAETANEAKTTFLTRMSHELRTPLNAIGGYTQLLRMGIRGTLTKQQEVDIERIERNQQHLLSLINDLLNYAKIEAGRLQYDIAPVLVRQALTSIEPLFEPRLRERSLSYRLDGDDDGYHVLADAEKLQQVLVNLVSNAVKFTPAGGSITMGARARGGRVEIRVTDTGIGIPTEKLEPIFEPFVQVRRPGEVSEGTGLGLAISRDLARGMQGDLRAESDGRGSTFILYLPKA